MIWAMMGEYPEYQRHVEDGGPNIMVNGIKSCRQIKKSKYLTIIYGIEDINDTY